MKFLALCLVLVMLCWPFAVAEATTPYDYLSEKGYTILRIDDSPGWKTCNLMGGNGWYGLSFSDDVDGWMIMSLTDFDPSFNVKEYEQLFIDLIEKYEWDIAFYWPGYEAGEKMVASYNLTEDLDQTSANYTTKESFVAALRESFKMAEPEVIEETVLPVQNSRRNPAAVGQAVSIDASRSGLDYTMTVVVDEFYRGDDYAKLMDGKGKKATDGYEYVAAKVTVTFESINYIQSSVLGTDDPEIMVDSIFNFDSYSNSGAKYDNVHYSISGKKELSYVYEGASTTGYFQFEVAEDDPAPMLVYEPEHDQKVFISLK